MRFRFILSETWNSLKRNVSMIISVMLVTFISFLFIGASVLMQAQITKAKGDWYDKVEVVVWLCPDGASQSANCSSGKAPTDSEIVDIEDKIQDELGMTMVLITHDVNEAVLLSDKTVFLEEGKVKQEVNIALPKPRRFGDQNLLPFQQTLFNFFLIV